MYIIYKIIPQLQFTLQLYSLASDNRGQHTRMQQQLVGVAWV